MFVGIQIQPNLRDSGPGTGTERLGTRDRGDRDLGLWTQPNKGLLIPMLTPANKLVQIMCKLTRDALTQSSSAAAMN